MRGDGFIKLSCTEISNFSIVDIEHQEQFFWITNSMAPASYTGFDNSAPNFIPLICPTPSILPVKSNLPTD